MIKLYLIRHGQSEWNKLGKVQGQINTSLTDLGKTQAKAIGNRLLDEGIDIIYASDLNRAFDTASIIGQEINKPVIASEPIREINFGVWEGLTGIEIREKYKDEHNIWLNDPESMKLDGAETLEVLKDRVMKWINPIIDEGSDKNIVIVSHSATLKVLLLGLLDIPLVHYKNITISNVGLNIIECRDYNKVLTKLNDISHLEGL